jgi:hypothetical protein
MQRAVEKAAEDERVFIAGPRVALADQAGRGGDEDGRRAAKPNGVIQHPLVD